MYTKKHDKISTIKKQNWMLHRKINLDLDLISITKFNSKWIID